MEQPTRWNGLNAWASRGDGNVREEEIEVIAAGNHGGTRPMAEDPGNTAAEAPATTWSSALTLVEEASAALRDSEERILQLEAEAEQQFHDSRSELEALQAQLRLAQREIERSYEQTAAAMARAAAAEAWLDKLGGTIVDSFGRLATTSQRPAS